MILQKSILKELTIVFITEVTILIAIVFFSQFLRISEMTISSAVDKESVIKIALFMLPQLLTLVVPAAYLISIIMVFGRMSSDMEITALESSGISIYKLMYIPLLIGSILCSIIFLNNAYYEPNALKLLRNHIAQVSKTNVLSSFQPGIFNNTIDNIVFMVEETSNFGKDLSKVFMVDSSRPGIPIYITAAEGEIKPLKDKNSLNLHLKNGNALRLMIDENKVQNMKFESANIFLNIDLLVRKYVSFIRDADTYTITELSRAINNNEVSGRQLKIFKISYHRKFALPLACIIFVFYGIVLGCRWRTTGRKGGYFIGVLTIVTYYVFWRLADGLGEAGSLPVYLAAWLPNFCFLTIGIWLFKKRLSL